MNDIIRLPEAGEFYSANGHYCVHLSSHLRLCGSRLRLSFPGATSSTFSEHAPHGSNLLFIVCLSNRLLVPTARELSVLTNCIFWGQVIHSVGFRASQSQELIWHNRRRRMASVMSICCFVKNVVKDINKSDITSCCDVKQLS